MSNVYDVVVVGAGAAGLVAAHLLTKKEKLRVKLLEGSGILGGRMYSRDGLFDWPIDLGGEFIHGELGLFKNLCDELGVTTVRTFSSFPPEPYFNDGRPVSEYLYLGLEGEMVSWEDLRRRDPSFQHLLDVIHAMQDDTSITEQENLYTYFVRKGVSQRMLRVADVIYAKTWAADLCDLNVRACIRENGKPFAGYDNYILERGTRELVQRLADGVDVTLNEEVTQVVVGDASKVITRNGNQYLAKKILMCVPISTLKSKSVTITPSLPAPFFSSLDQCGVGVSVKGVLRFSRRFWPEHMLLVFCSDCIVPQLWMDPPRPNYPQKKTNSQGDEPSAITCFVTGTPAKALLQMPTWKVVALFLNQLDQMFATKENKRPASQSFEDHSICRWEQVAYTYPAHLDAPEALSVPQHGEKLFFAGEHCGVKASEIATINGALESGKEASEKIVKSLRKSKL